MIRWVVKIWFIFVLLGTLRAQVASNYQFVELTGNYTPIVGTSVGATTDDDQIYMGGPGSAGTQTSSGYPIGFTFNYGGTSYTRFGVSSNGYIKLGNLPAFTMKSNGYYQSMSATNDDNLIGGMVNDLQGQVGSSLQYTTLGTAPNRSLVVQWRDYKIYGTVGEIINFQIILYESTEIIDVAYGDFIYGKNHQGYQGAAMVGLMGANNNDFFLRSTNWKSSGKGNSKVANIPYNKYSMPVKNTIFRFSPLNSPLPIVLANWEASCTVDSIIFSWSTLTEINNNFYTIEHSNDGYSWEQIATLKGAGNSSQPLNYALSIKNNLGSGHNYFKLKQTDFDGKYKYSKTIVTNCPDMYERPFLIFPNPAINILTVMVPDDGGSIRIFNSYGQQVFLISSAQSTTELPLNDLVPGAYYLTYNSKSATSTKAFVISR